MALAMTQFLKLNRTNIDTPTVSFEATISGIESYFSEYPDAVLIVDDYRPANSRAEENLLRQKLERVTRVYGDHNSIKRMSAFSGVKTDYVPENMCIITGEIAGGGSASSLSRIIKVMTDRRQCNNEVLSYYQQNMWILSTHMYDFISYVTDNGIQIVEYIRERLPIMRNKYKNVFSAERYCDAYIIMQVI